MYDLGGDHVDYVRNVAGMQARSSAGAGMLSCLPPGAKQRQYLVRDTNQEFGHGRMTANGASRMRKVLRTSPRVVQSYRSCNYVVLA